MVYTGDWKPGVRRSFIFLEWILIPVFIQLRYLEYYQLF